MHLVAASPTPVSHRAGVWGRARSRAAAWVGPSGAIGAGLHPVQLALSGVPLVGVACFPAGTALDRVDAWVSSMAPDPQITIGRMPGGHTGPKSTADVDVEPEALADTDAGAWDRDVDPVWPPGLMDALQAGIETRHTQRPADILAAGRAALGPISDLVAAALDTDVGWPTPVPASAGAGAGAGMGVGISRAEAARQHVTWFGTGSAAAAAASCLLTRNGVRVRVRLDGAGPLAPRSSLLSRSTSGAFHVSPSGLAAANQAVARLADRVAVPRAGLSPEELVLEKALQHLRLWMFLVRDTWPDLPGWLPVGLPPGRDQDELVALVASPAWRARPSLTGIPSGMVWLPGRAAGTPVVLLPWVVEAGLRAVAAGHQVPVLLPTCTPADGPAMRAVLAEALNAAVVACRDLVVNTQVQPLLDATRARIHVVLQDINAVTAGVPGLAGR